MKISGIVFYNRSGSFFLSSLLDGHPNVLALPPYVLASFYSFWNEFIKSENLDEVFQEFLQHYDILFDSVDYTPSKYMPPGMAKISNLEYVGNKKFCVEKDKFIEYFHMFLNKHSSSNLSFRAKFIVTVHQAFHAAYFATVDVPEHIIYQLHSPSKLNLTEFYTDFPDARLMHMIREPIVSLGSHIKHFQHEYQMMNESILYVMIKEMLYSAIPFNGDYENIKGVKFEALHASTESTMKRVCQFNQLSWDDCLMESTFLKEEWVYINQGEVIKGANNKTSSRKHSDLFSDLDRAKICTIMRREFDKWDYPVEDMLAINETLYDFDFVRNIVGKRSDKIENLVKKYLDFKANIPEAVEII